MTILSGDAILSEFAAGAISIAPFHTELINPASFDLTLGSEVVVYRQRSWLYRACLFLYCLVFLRRFTSVCLDARRPNPTERRTIPEGGIVLRPGVLYLMHTRERVHTDKFVGVVDGKSSIGRLGIQVHLTAGYIDPGFNGQITLEVICVHPVRVYAGMRIAQIRFEPIQGRVSLYDGHYKHATAEGAIASRSWEQFG